MLSKALELSVCFHRGPVLGEHGRTFLSYELREKDKISFFIRRTFIKEFKRNVKEGSGNRQLST